MTTHAAICVDDDLATGQARVTHRATHDETTGRVDEHFGTFPINAFRFEHRRDDALDHVSLDLRNLDVGPVLRGHEDLLHGNRLVVDIAHGHLGLAIGVEIIQHAVLTHLREALGQTMREVDRHGHER